MADQKRGNGHDPSTAKMLDVLERIEGRLEVGFRDVAARIDQTNARLDQTNARLDHLIELSGSTYRDHEARLSKIEMELARLNPRARSRRTPARK